MRILVDADACPVKKEIMKVARKYNLEVHMFIDVNHRLEGYDAVVHTCDQGADSVDLALINTMLKEDIVVTSDYGVASLALSKSGHVVHNNGYIIDDNNIDSLMFQRHMNRKERQSGKRGARHKKRTQEDNLTFLNTLELLVINLIK